MKSELTISEPLGVWRSCKAAYEVDGKVYACREQRNIVERRDYGDRVEIVVVGKWGKKTMEQVQEEVNEWNRKNGKSISNTSRSTENTRH